MIDFSFKNRTKLALALWCSTTLAAWILSYYCISSISRSRKDWWTTSKVANKCNANDLGKESGAHELSKKDQEEGLRLVSTLRSYATRSFQLENFSEALDFYDKCIPILTSFNDRESAEQVQVLTANIVLCLYKLRLFSDACEVATSLLEDKVFLNDTLKSKTLYRRALASASLGEKHGAIADLKACIKFSPGGKNPEAERELSKLLA